MIACMHENGRDWFDIIILIVIVCVDVEFGYCLGVEIIIDTVVSIHVVEI